MLISRASIEAQEFYYTQNNHNDFNFMETLMFFFGALDHQCKNTKRQEFNLRFVDGEVGEI